MIIRVYRRTGIQTCIFHIIDTVALQASGQLAFIRFLGIELCHRKTDQHPHCI
jgi:hypothetical protein